MGPSLKADPALDVCAYPSLPPFNPSSAGPVFNHRPFMRSDKPAQHPSTRTNITAATQWEPGNMSTHQHTHLRGSGTATPTGTHGSQTVLQTDAGPSIPIPSGTLRLRAEPQERRRIQWAEDVVDNEGMGKKSSKVCCIYHKPHEPGDSDSDSSDSSSSSDSDSDDEPDLSRARKAGGSGRKGRGDGHRHDHDHGNGDCNGKGKGKAKERKPSPNAYERQPKHKSKKEG